jgi:hypothetical protein
MDQSYVIPGEDTASAKRGDNDFELKTAAPPSPFNRPATIAKAMVFLYQITIIAFIPQPLE